jgi:hypothetical protein
VLRNGRKNTKKIEQTKRTGQMKWKKKAPKATKKEMFLSTLMVKRKKFFEIYYTFI